MYTFSPSTGELSGVIKLDVHYFEDGNVRLQTEKKIDDKVGESATEVVRAVAVAERRYQEDLNKAFPMLNEDAFKNLRRQLPVTRQKVDWDKIGGYRVSRSIMSQGVSLTDTAGPRYRWSDQIRVTTSALLKYD